MKEDTSNVVRLDGAVEPERPAKKPAKKRAAKTAKKTAAAPKATAKPKATTKKVELFDRHLPVPLTDDELAERRDALVLAIDELDVLEEKKKAAAAGYKKQQDALRAQLKKTAGEVRERKTYRDIPCFKEEDFTLREVRIIRTDTRAVLERRAMTAVEMQTTLEDV